MSRFTLNVEVLAGTAIGDAIEEAKAKCRMFDLAYVCFKFNGVSASIGQDADVRKGVAKFEKALKENRSFFVENGNK